MTETPLGQHLIEANVVGSGKNTAISGGHNMGTFNATLQANGGTVVSKTEISPGIYQFEYQLPGGKVQPKTVYDPAKYSDTQMANMASEATGKAIIQYQLTGNPKQFVTVNGATFTVPISIRGGQPTVPTAFPTVPGGKP